MAIVRPRALVTKFTSAEAKGDINMNYDKLHQLLEIEEMLRNQPTFKPIYDAVVKELAQMAANMTKATEVAAARPASDHVPPPMAVTPPKPAPASGAPSSLLQKS
jgi:hypothetical protein